MDYAFEFIINNGGIDTEEDYPYNGFDSSCIQYKKNARVGSVEGYVDLVTARRHVDLCAKERRELT
ncbi:C1 family peptidase, partial [Escherichia coli]|uniref:C1 family peptidase n=1 Tax=Escherichia coli TaxID=562 RepID=UPI002001159E